MPIGLVAIAVLLGTNLACENAASPCVCTGEFRIHTVMVRDDTGNLVDDVTITRTNQRTGETLEPETLALMMSGVYVVADDSMLEDFSSDGDLVLVTGVKGGATFEATFEFAVPEPCRCHVEKLSGPETVIIGESSL